MFCNNNFPVKIEGSEYPEISGLATCIEATPPVIIGKLNITLGSPGIVTFLAVVKLKVVEEVGGHDRVVMTKVSIAIGLELAPADVYIRDRMAEVLIGGILAENLVQDVGKTPGAL